MAGRRREVDVDWTETQGETRAELLRRMRWRARTVSELADGVGISTNAVRGHVAALERDGLVMVVGREATGGKPARRYGLTPAAEELFPKAYSLVLKELVALFREETGAEGAESVLRRIGRRLAARSGGATSSDGEEAVARAAEALESLGGAVEVQAQADGWELKSAGCPFSDVVRDEPGVCALAESLVAEITGRTVEERCDRGARPRCTFRVRESAGS